MELNEKLQFLRKQKNLTQEELAESLYVSRTAIPKWESCRETPSIDSLKALAAFFHVTIDELLSIDELLTIAEEENKQKEKQFRALTFGLLDVSTAMIFFLPFFAQETETGISAVALLSLTGLADWLKTVYFVIAFVMIVSGVMTLGLQNWPESIWNRVQSKVSFCVNVLAAVVFVVSLQPYAAVYMLVYLIIKALMLIKWA